MSIKFTCPVCNKDLTNNINDTILEETKKESEGQDTNEVVVCPDCYGKGHCAALCNNCGSQYGISGEAKIAMIAQVMGEEKSIKINGQEFTSDDLINKSYMFVINGCPDCSDDPQSVQIISIMSTDSAETHIFKDLKFPDSVIILDSPGK